MLLRRAYGLAWLVVPVHCCCLCCPQVAGSIELLCPDACPCFSKKKKKHSFYYSCYLLGECQPPHTMVKMCSFFKSCSSGNTHVQDHDNFLINPFDITGCLCILLHCLMTCCVGSATPSEPPWMFSVGWSGSSLTTSNPQVLKALSLSAYLTGTPGLCLPSSPLFSTSLRCFMFPFSPLSSYLGLIKSFITSPSSTPSRKHC